MIVGNQEFLKICGAIGQKNTQSLHSLTAFDIVAPTMIPKLYEIFLMALTLDHDNYYYPCESDTDVDVRGGEESDVKYPSLTVPCVNFGTHEQSYYITVSVKFTIFFSPIGGRPSSNTDFPCLSFSFL